MNYLPNRVYLTSETAPPPQNPRLQHCLEEHMFGIYDENGQTIRVAIDKASTLDFSYLPDKPRDALAGSFDKARSTFDMVAAVRKAAADYQANLVNYAPLHREVRDEQKRIRINEEKIKEA